jgi:diaminopimelate epimerase
MDFTKMQGAGNDFVLIEAGEEKKDWSKLAIAMCDRHLGIGADSLLILFPSTKADFCMRTFDTDGSEAETCGNGIRCVARYVLETGLISRDAESVLIETISSVNRVKFERENGQVVKFWANMGKPELSAENIPAKLKAGEPNVALTDSMLSYKVNAAGMELVLNLVSMGNPHAVHFTKEPVSEFPLAKIGPIVENLPAFPNRMNFEVACVKGAHNLQARVWERGVGETQACGSGACAITVASKLSGFTESKVDITLPGGVLNAEWNGSREVILGGPAEKVFTGKWLD